jgi:predicted transcriptional regulator
MELILKKQNKALVEPENPEGRLATAEEIEATVDSWISEHDI